MWKLAAATAFAVLGLVGEAAACGPQESRSAQSGAERLLCTFHGIKESGLNEGVRFKLAQPPANGTARVVNTTLSSGTGKPIRVAQVFYKSKPGFVGTDSFTYQRIGRDGAVRNFSMSVNVR